jgi:hypothetical protein
MLDKRISSIHVDLVGTALRVRVEFAMFYRRDNAVPFLLSRISYEWLGEDVKANRRRRMLAIMADSLRGIGSAPDSIPFRVSW